VNTISTTIKRPFKVFIKERSNSKQQKVGGMLFSWKREKEVETEKTE
jgi:hypothetical protein